MLIIPDRKQDFFDLVKPFGLHYFLKEDFLDNLCAPPDGVEDMAWFNILGEICAIFLELRALGQSIITEALYRIAQEFKKHYQTYPSLYDVGLGLTHSAKGSAGSANFKIGQRLLAISKILGPISRSRHQTNWIKLIKHDWALSLAGLAISNQNFIITIIIAKALLYRIYNNLHSAKLETLIVLDEASTIFPKTSTKKTALLLDYFQQARAFGIGFIFASQSMNLADEIFANTAIKVCVGGFGHGSDYEAFGSAVGLNRSQRDYMRTINRPGAAVIKDIRYPYPFTAQIERPDND